MSVISGQHQQHLTHRQSHSRNLSRAPSEIFSASQYGGSRGPLINDKLGSINYFLIPIFVLEIIGLACLWALFYYHQFTDVFPYHRRTFYCHDDSLMKPDFTPDDFILYVSYETLYCVSFIIPPIVILIGEAMFYLFSTRPRKTVYANCRECKISLFARRLLRFIGVFMFGALIVCIFIDSIKLITGYQRPYFLTTCRLNYTQCPAPFNHSPERNPRIACINPRESDLRYAWLTFPSIFAGLSSFAAIFTSCYIHYMISMRGAPLLRPFLIAGFAGMSLIASFSRIQGYKNHWVDIWVGWLIGAAWAFYLCWDVLAFQEFYRASAASSAADERIDERTLVQQQDDRVPPFFAWFKLPRITTARQFAEKEDAYGPTYYEEEQESPLPERASRRKDQNRIYEVTTTTESFERTIQPPGQGHPEAQQPDGQQHRSDHRREHYAPPMHSDSEY